MRNLCYTLAMSNKIQSPPLVRLDKRKIRSVMALHDITVQQIADHVGVTRQAIYNAMNGQNTTLDTVSGIAAVLGVDPVSILVVDTDA